MIKKAIKFLSGKLFYILIGIFLSISIFSVKAAWNTEVSTGGTLTRDLWNDVVRKLVELDNRVLEIESGSVTVRNNRSTVWRWPTVLANCLADEVVVGGGGSCTGPSGYTFITWNIPSGNGWQLSCDTPVGQNITANVYAMCLKR